jgi:hypothetical protein
MEKASVLSVEKTPAMTPRRHDDLNLFFRDELGSTLLVFPVYLMKLKKCHVAN